MKAAHLALWGKSLNIGPLLLLAAMSVARAGDLENHGQAILQTNCSDCHAIGKDGNSPNPAAPPFRNIDQRYDMDSLHSKLREGVVSLHPDMPTFHFSRE